MQNSSVDTLVSPSSPRIIALQQALDAGNTKALTEFWQSVEAEGTPLIDPLPDDDRHALVTFLWQRLCPTEILLLRPNPLCDFLRCCNQQLIWTLITMENAKAGQTSLKKRKQRELKSGD